MIAMTNVPCPDCRCDLAPILAIVGTLPLENFCCSSKTSTKNGAEPEEKNNVRCRSRISLPIDRSNLLIEDSGEDDKCKRGKAVRWLMFVKDHATSTGAVSITHNAR